MLKYILYVAMVVKIIKLVGNQLKNHIIMKCIALHVLITELYTRLTTATDLYTN